MFIFPKVGCPLYSRDEAPLNCASNLPLRFIWAWLAPLRLISVLLTGRFEKSRLLAPESTETRSFAVPVAVNEEAPDNSVVMFPA